MPYKLKLTKTIEPEKNALEKMGSPIGWWNVTTEGDCEGRTTNQLGDHYGHIAEIALSMKGGGYSLRFVKAQEPNGVYGSPEDHHKIRKLARKAVNISLDCWSHKGGELGLEKWLDCPEIVVTPCNYYGAYTIHLKT